MKKVQKPLGTATKSPAMRLRLWVCVWAPFYGVSGPTGMAPPIFYCEAVWCVLTPAATTAVGGHGVEV